MHFSDNARIILIAGRGGDGMISYRREKYIPRGGPNGGNGGNGADVVFKLNTHLNTLSNYRTKRIWKGENGGTGGTYELAGKNAPELILEVPEGTIIKDVKTGKVLADISEENPVYVALHGGRGGFGNAHFTSSTRQCPDFAEYGDIGQEKEVELELKLIADLGIIGFPNVGKSTLISVISNAKPKIADYPFTTIVPNRGIVDHKGRSILVCDTPGLIEGASEGKGLGIQFLKHIERTNGLIHLIDATLTDPELIKYSFDAIRKELKNYSKELEKKPELIVINKIDIISPQERKEFEKSVKKLLGKDVLFISAGSKEGIEEFLDKLFEFNEKHKITKETKVVEKKYKEMTDEDGNIYLAEVEKAKDKTESSEYTVFKPHLDDPNNFNAERVKEGVFRLRGDRIEQIARMTMWHLPSAVERFYDIMAKNNMLKSLHKLGAKVGDKVLVDEFDIELI